MSYWQRIYWSDERGGSFIHHGFLLTRLLSVEFIAITVIGHGLWGACVFFAGQLPVRLVAQMPAIERAIPVAAITAVADEKLLVTVPAGNNMPVQALLLSDWSWDCDLDHFLQYRAKTEIKTWVSEV